MKSKHKSSLPLPIVQAQVILTFGEKYTHKLTEVEVLTVHFNSGMMRVRYTCDDYFGQGPKVQTTDIPAEPFLKKFHS